MVEWYWLIVAVVITIIIVVLFVNLFVIPDKELDYELEKLKEKMREKPFEQCVFDFVNFKIPLLETTEELEERLADRKLQEEFPLTYSIKHNENSFVELFVSGKSIGRYEIEEAIDFSKKYLKQEFKCENEKYYGLRRKENGTKKNIRIN